MVAIDLDAHVTGGLGRLLVRRLEGVLQRDEEDLGVDRLLSLQLVYGFEDVFAHSVTGFQTMFDFTTLSRGTSTSTPSSSSSRSDVSSAAVRRPRRSRCPWSGFGETDVHRLAERARVVRGADQRAFDAGRGDLETTLVAEVGEGARDLGAEVGVDALGMLDQHPDEVAPP